MKYVIIFKNKSIMDKERFLGETKECFFSTSLDKCLKFNSWQDAHNKIKSFKTDDVLFEDILMICKYKEVKK